MHAQADVRLFQTLIRFDHVYVVYFKCNRNFIHQMPNVANYVRDMYQTPGAPPGTRPVACVESCVQGRPIRIADVVTLTEATRETSQLHAAVHACLLQPC